MFNIITAEGEILPLESVFLTEGGIAFPYPNIDEVGEVRSTQFLFTRDNSNIDLVLGSKPVAIDYDVNALTNPNNDTSIRGFITDSSYYKVRVDVDLPLNGRAANFAVRDTYDLDLSAYDQIRSIEFKLITDNGLPLAVEVQGAFLDAQGNVLALLFPAAATVIGGAAVNAQGLPTGPNSVTTFIDWDAAQVETIRRANRLVLTTSFSTTQGLDRSVKILNNQFTQVRLGAIIKVGEN